MADIDHEADVIRLYVSTFWRNLLGDRADDRTRARVLDAVEKLVVAARAQEVSHEV